MGVFHGATPAQRTPIRVEKMDVSGKKKEELEIIEVTDRTVHTSRTVDARFVEQSRSRKSEQEGKINGVLSIDHGKSDKPTKSILGCIQRKTDIRELRNQGICFHASNRRAKRRRKGKGGRLTGHCSSDGASLKGGNHDLFHFCASTPIMKYG